MKKFCSKFEKKIFEHIQWLNEILIDFEKIDCIIFDEKFQFCCVDIRIVKFIYNDDEKHLNIVKIIKIVKWFFCTNVAKIRKFIEIYMYYRIFIEKFVIIFVSIYMLLKKNVIFVWKSKQQKIMNILKMKFVNSSVLITFDYKFAKKIILIANVNLKNWKKIFMQIKNKKRHFCKYENDMWNVIKAKNDAIKRECCEILKYFKKFRYYLYNVHFILKIDAKILIAQFNRSNIDFSDALLTRWIAWIRLFDFNVRHVKNKKHIVIDELSRRLVIEEKRQTINKKINIDEWIELKLKNLRMFFVILSAEKQILKNEYFDKLKKKIRYFMILQKLSEMNTKKFRKWKIDVFKFKIQNRYFFRRNSKNIFMRCVINNFEIKKF